MNMKSKHLTEPELEAIAKAIINTSINQTSQEYLHINECSLCKDKLEFFIEFYKNYFSLTDKKIMETEVLTREIINPKFTVLKRFRPRIEIDELTGENAYLLAADSKEKEENSEYEEIATFYSEEKDLLVRAVKDSEANCIRISVLANDELKASYSLFAIADNNETKLFFATDADGSVLVSNSYSINWNTAELLLFNCTEEFEPEYLTTDKWLEKLNKLKEYKYNKYLLIKKDYTSEICNIEVLHRIPKSEILKIKIFS